ncbi:MAG: hypothetical protein GY781_11090 [Gammaproteobacteria bacterium]|nr:hypothetical protein [Gammaproteobacteria bacterium]
MDRSPYVLALFIIDVQGFIGNDVEKIRKIFTSESMFKVIKPFFRTVNSSEFQENAAFWIGDHSGFIDKLKSIL